MVKSLDELRRLARNQVSESVSEQDRQSLPIPVKIGSTVRVKFLYAPALARPNQPVQIWPPNHMATLALDGSLVEFRSVSPLDFGLAQPNSSNALGPFNPPNGLTWDHYQTSYVRLLQLFDHLLDDFNGNRANLPKEKKAILRESIALFHQLAEPPLTSYYAFVGRDFFAWADRALR